MGRASWAGPENRVQIVVLGARSLFCIGLWVDLTDFGVGVWLGWGVDFADWCQVGIFIDLVDWLVCVKGLFVVGGLVGTELLRGVLGLDGRTYSADERLKLTLMLDFGRF
jgi:hypothetical protein